MSGIVGTKIVGFLMPGSNIIVCFSVDCRNAGKGKLEVNCETKDSRKVPTYVRPEGDGLYNASFTPIDSDHYYVAIAYNKAEIRGEVY